MKYINVLIIALLMLSCSEDHPNIIAKNQLGSITADTHFDEIENLFTEDSVVYTNRGDAFGSLTENSSQIIKVYDTSGQNILLINPLRITDSIVRVKNIRVLTDRFKTSNGIGLGSEFIDIKKHHDVSNIQSSLKSLIISLEDINALVSFDRSVLPGDVRFDIEADIKAVMIPDDAKVNRFWLNFEAEGSNDKK